MIPAITAQLPLLAIVLAGTLIAAAIWACAGSLAHWARGVLRGLAFAAVCMAAFFLGVSLAARAAWRLLCRLFRFWWTAEQQRAQATEFGRPARIKRWLYCGPPWLWVMNVAEKRARPRYRMARNHPERVAYFYRKAPWAELQARTWPDPREWVDIVEADMRERGWRQP
jgi:hypothetical protein